MADLTVSSAVDTLMQAADAAGLRTAISLSAIATTESFGWSGRSKISSSADGYIALTDNAGTAFTGLRFGGSTSSFPMLKRNSATLEIKLADDSAYAFLNGKFRVGDQGVYEYNSGAIYYVWSGTGGVSSFGGNFGSSAIGLAVPPANIFGFSASATNAATIDVRLYRDAAGILAQRNGANAQAFRVYNTYTSGSAYEAFRIDWQASANSCIIGTTTVGGSQRDLLVQGATIYFMPSNATKAFINSSTFGLSEGVNVQVGTSTGTKIGSNATQKLGFWGATPVVQPTLSAQATKESIVSMLQTIGLAASGSPTTPQTTSVYNTYTDASNYESIVLDWNTTANTARVGVKAAGSGTLRTMQLPGARRQVTATIDAPTAGTTTTSLVIPIACTIVGYKLLAVGVTGTATVDVWKKASAVPTVADTIVASAPVTGSSVFTDSTTLTGWTTSIAANDVIKFNVTATGGATNLVVVLDLREA